MDELRFLLLGAGILLIAGIYFFERRRSRRRRTALLDDEWAELPPDAGTAVAETEPEEDEQETLIAALSIVAPKGRRFLGQEVFGAIGQAGLVFGRKGVWYAPADLEQPDGPALFLVANMVEPGSLDPAQADELSTPGIYLFARLPGPIPGNEVLDLMLAAGRFMAEHLGGTLCDGEREPLDDVMELALRRRIETTVGDRIAAPPV